MNSECNSPDGIPSTSSIASEVESTNRIHLDRECQTHNLRKTDHRCAARIQSPLRFPKKSRPHPTSSAAPHADTQLSTVQILDGSGTRVRGEQAKDQAPGRQNWRLVYPARTRGSSSALLLQRGIRALSCGARDCDPIRAPDLLASNPIID